MKIHKFLIEDKNALRYYEQTVKFAKSKLSGKENFENQAGEDHGDTVDE